MKSTEKGKRLKNQLAVAVTAALLALPFSLPMALAETTASTTTSAEIISTDTTNVDTTSTDTTGTDTTSTDTTSTDTTGTDTTSTDTSTTDTDAEDTDTNSEDTTGSDNQNTDNEDTESPVVDADGNEIEPANWFSDLIGKLKIALTFDPARKCELNQERALAKLAKARILMADGKTEESEKAFSQYSDKIAKAQEFLEQVEDPESEKAKKLTIALTNVNQNNIQVLGNLLEKLPPQAAQRLAFNVVRSMEKAVTKMEKQEAKIAAVSTPETLPETTANPTDSKITPPAHNKSLERQAKAALKEFKKSLKRSGKIKLGDDQEESDQNENQDEDQNQDQSEEGSEADAAPSQETSLANTQPTSVTIAPAKVQYLSTADRSSIKEKEDWKKQDRDKQDNNRKDKGGEKNRDKKQDNQRDNR